MKPETEMTVAQYEQHLRDEAMALYVQHLPNERIPAIIIAKHHAAMAMLGFADATRQQHRATLARYAALGEATANADLIATDLATAEKLLADHQLEAARIRQDLDAKGASLARDWEAKGTAARRVGDAQRAREELALEHWQILNLPNPAATANRRHLYVSYADRPSPVTQYEAIAFQFAAMIPGGYGNPFNFDFLPHEGQSQSELDAMVQAWRDLYSKKIGLAVFLIPDNFNVTMSTAANPGGAGHPMLYRESEAIELAKGSPSAASAGLDPTQALFLQHPGDTSNFEAMVARVRKAHAAGERARRKLALQYEGPDETFDQWAGGDGRPWDGTALARA